MEYGKIIDNAVHYVFNDTNKFIKLAIPNIIVGVMLALCIIPIYFSAGGIYNVNPVSVLFGMSILGIITFIIGVIVAIIDYGIMIGVIKETLKGNELPDLNIITFFSDGLKSFVVYLIYNAVVYVIFFIFVGLAFSIESEGLYVMGDLIYLILSLIVTLLLPVAYGKLSESNSISEALSIEKVWEITNNIGLVEIFVLLLIVSIFTIVIAVLSLFLLLIPLIGPIIIMMIVTFLVIFMARIYGLIYLEQHNQSNIYSPYSQQQESQIYQQNQNININTKVCPYCGQHNMMNVNQCVTCGNLLQNDERISNRYETISNYSQGILCPQCGTDNTKDATFCTSCGTTLSNTTNRSFCRNCGSPLDENAVFCDNCGTKK
ncbi:MAG: DUF4013 domain-containing protein [Methanosphaera stadtmanae]|nr:DUF4013 domain-containing protein [Methanosphaera stadtmanae]